MKNVRVTKPGVVILVVLGAAIVLAVWGSGPLKGIAIAVIAVVVLVLAGEGMSGGRGSINADDARKREVLGRDAKKRRFDDAP
jgi:uncharacterized membrane protein